MLYLRNSQHEWLYIHLNNDVRGNDGRGGPQTAYARGLRSGMHVRAGQEIAYVGNSGDAEGGASHLHFEEHSANGRPHSPYKHLRAAPIVAFSAVATAGKRAAAQTPTFLGRMTWIAGGDSGIYVRAAIRLTSIRMGSRTVTTQEAGRRAHVGRRGRRRRGARSPARWCASWPPPLRSPSPASCCDRESGRRRPSPPGERPPRHPRPAAARVDRVRPPDAPPVLRERDLRGDAGRAGRLRRRRAGARARHHPGRAGAADLRRARPAAVGAGRPGLRDRRREVDVPELPAADHVVVLHLAVPAAQPLLPARPQHDHHARRAGPRSGTGSTPPRRPA